MAGRLTTPQDFVANTNERVQHDMELLPPSVFSHQPRSRNNPWKDFEKLTEQLFDVKKENERLNDLLLLKAKDETIEHAKEHKSSPSIHFVTAPNDARCLEDLIQRQATEIQRLKGDLEQLRCDKNEAVSTAQTRASVAEETRKNDVARLQKEWRDKEALSQLKFQTLQTEHEARVAELDKYVADLRAALVQAESDNQSKMCSLQHTLEKEMEQRNQAIESLEAQLRSQTELAQSLREEVHKFKSYIGSVDAAPPDVSRQEIHALKTKLEAEQKSGEKLRSTLDITNIRLTSLLEIQRLQESQLSKVTTKNLDKEDKEQLLLTKWREKVFALLVQRESAAITLMNSENTWRNKEVELQGELESAKREARILTHTLSDHEAQLRLQADEKAVLEAELTDAQKAALQLDDQLTQQFVTVQNMTTFTQTMSEVFDTFIQQLVHLDDTLKSYGQRISFASGRIDVCKAQFTRQKAMIQHQRDPTSQCGEGPWEKNTVSDDSTQNISRLQEELKKVVEERDKLAEQIKSDWSMLQERIDRATQNCLENERSKVEQAKREHTKAVVELRQLERKVARDAEQATARDHASHRVYAQQIAQLQKQVRELQSERKITMAIQDSFLATATSQCSTKTTISPSTDVFLDTTSDNNNAEKALKTDDTEENQNEDDNLCIVPVTDDLHPNTDELQMPLICL